MVQPHAYKKCSKNKIAHDFLLIFTNPKVFYHKDVHYVHSTFLANAGSTSSPLLQLESALQRHRLSSLLACHLRVGAV